MCSMRVANVNERALEGRVNTNKEGECVGEVKERREKRRVGANKKEEHKKDAWL